MKNYNNENVSYLTQLLGEERWNAYLTASIALANGNPVTDEEWKAHETVINYLDAMEGFGDNRWWTSNDKKVVGYYQLLNPLLLVDFSKFHESVEALLQRSVWTHEFGLNWEGLKAEAERAFHGETDTEEQRGDAIRNSFEQLANFCEENNKPLLGVVVE